MPFEKQVESAMPQLTRAATVLCRCRGDIDDAVQETLIRAHNAFGNFRGDASFFTWSYRILLRVTQKMNQKWDRALPDAEDLPMIQTLPAVDRSVIRDEQARQVIDAIRSLPGRQREMITLHFMEHLTYHEIASTLEVSLGTVKATIFQAKKNLRSILEKQNLNLKSFYVLP